MKRWCNKIGRHNAFIKEGLLTFKKLFKLLSLAIVNRLVWKRRVKILRFIGKFCPESKWGKTSLRRDKILDTSKLHKKYYQDIIYWLSIIANYSSSKRGNTQQAILKSVWWTEWGVEIIYIGFSCGSAGKEFTCNEGDMGSFLGLGRYSGGGKGYPHQ